jgi:HAD superfamily hydrolase (TIGR01490 family)
VQPPEPDLRHDPAEPVALEVLPHGAGAVQLTGTARERRDRIEPDPLAAAFFDLDNTMVKGASIFHFAKGMYRRGFFDARTIVKALWFQTYFRAAGKEKAAHVADARETMLGFIKGHTVAEIAQVGEEVYEEFVSQRVWPGTRAIAQLHLDAGQQVWLVTAAPVEMAGIIASRLGLTGALGTTAEHESGVYTGRLVGDMLHGPAKADAIRDLALEHGLDLARSFAYSDSANDLPMLSLVGHPCAINPDRRLSAYADEQDWQVRDFRTGRRAARLGLLGAGGAGAALGAVAAVVSVTRYLRRG